MIDMILLLTVVIVVYTKELTSQAMDVQQTDMSWNVYSFSNC